MASSVPLAPTPPDAITSDVAYGAKVATPQASSPPVTTIRTLTNSLYAALRRRSKVLATPKTFWAQS